MGLHSYYTQNKLQTECGSGNKYKPICTKQISTNYRYLGIKLKIQWDNWENLMDALNNDQGKVNEKNKKTHSSKIQNQR